MNNIYVHLITALVAVEAILGLGKYMKRLNFAVSAVERSTNFQDPILMPW